VHGGSTPGVLLTCGGHAARLPCRFAREELSHERTDEDPDLADDEAHGPKTGEKGVLERLGARRAGLGAGDVLVEVAAAGCATPTSPTSTTGCPRW